jgi:hypothetical protein
MEIKEIKKIEIDFSREAINKTLKKYGLKEREGEE